MSSSLARTLVLCFMFSLSSREYKQVSANSLLKLKHKLSNILYAGSYPSTVLLIFLLARFMLRKPELCPVSDSLPARIELFSSLDQVYVSLVQ